MPAACHAVGDDGGQQAFDAAEQGEGQRRGQDLDDLLERDRGNMRRRQAMRNAAEARADRLDRETEGKAEKRGDDDRDEETRPMRLQAPDREDQDDAQQRDADSRRAHCRPGLPKRFELGRSSPGSLPVSLSPKRSLIWLAKMMTAMPAVKPTVTG